jgi:TPR repeat protein
MACLAAASLRGDVYDCSKGLPGILFQQVFGQLSVGVECTDDGEIVSAPGKRMPLNEFTKVAFLHYVARTNPTITLPQLVRCSACNGKGGNKGIYRNPNDPLDIGRIVDERCATCNGSGGSIQQLTLTVTFTGPFPPWPDSPKQVAFRGRLAAARDGNAAAQLEVGRAFLDGKYVTKDADEARGWLTKAAAQGKREACEPLARLYLDAGNSFHDYAYGLALSAVVNPELVQAEGPDFVSFRSIVNASPDPVTALQRSLQVLEASLLAPRIAQGLATPAEAEKVLSPEAARKGFPAKPPLAAGAVLPPRALFIRGLSMYFGYGHPAPDQSGALRLWEAAACGKEAEAFYLLALHYDAAKAYPSSVPTAWVFYDLANQLGAKDPYCAARLRQLALTEVANDWAGVPEVTRATLQQGKFTPGLLRDLADLSLYRTLRAGTDFGTPYATATTQGTPLPKALVLERAHALLRSKLDVVEVSPVDESTSRKCWDDGVTRYYAVSGLVAFANAGAVRETVPYTLCFKVTDEATPPTLLYLSAGSVHFGALPVECGRRL